jgi:xanthine/uracil permease
LGLIINNRKHLLTRFPIWFALIVLFGLFPLLIGVVGGWITELSTGEPCHEGNCGWMVLPWLTLFTLPIGGVLLFVYMIIILIDIIGLLKEE